MAGLALVTFLPAVGHDFVNYDDDVYVYRNADLAATPDLAGGLRQFAQFSCRFYHPLTMVSLMTDTALFGRAPWGYHLSAVVLHAVGAGLLFVALFRLTVARWPSAFVAAVFAVHPLRVESVAWVAERKDVLSGLFFALTLLAYSAYVRSPSRLRYGAVLGAFVAGLLAKPVLVTLPFLLLLLDFWPLRRMEGRSGTLSASAVRRLALEKFPLLLLAAIACGLAVVAQGESVIGLREHPLIARLGNVPTAYVTYIVQTVFPMGLSPFYPLGPISWPRVLAASVGLVGVTVWSLCEIRRRPWLFVGWSWYLGLLVPTIGLVQIGAFAHADRFTYLPQIGLLIALTWTAADVAARVKVPRAGMMAGAGLLLAACVARSVAQTKVWRNSETLFRHTLTVTNDNAVAHFNLGVALEESGRAAEALDHYRRAVQLWPSYPHARENLGFALADHGQAAEAISHLEQAVAADPDHAKALMVLGACYSEVGRPESALTVTRRASRADPDDPMIARALGALLRRLGRLDEAISHYEIALRRHPADPDLQNNLAVALCFAGREQEAIAHFHEALRLRPDHADARRNLDAVLELNPGLAP